MSIWNQQRGSDYLNSLGHRRRYRRIDQVTEADAVIAHRMRTSIALLVAMPGMRDAAQRKAQHQHRKSGTQP